MSCVDSFQDEHVVEHYRQRFESMTAVGAKHLLTLAGITSGQPKPASPSKAVLLDNAAGAGIVTSLLLSDKPAHEHVTPARRHDVFVHAVDDSQGMCSHMQKRAVQETWPGDAYKIAKMDSQSLSFSDETFDASITSYGVFLFADSAQGLKGTLLALTRFSCVYSYSVQRSSVSRRREALWLSTRTRKQSVLPEAEAEQRASSWTQLFFMPILQEAASAVSFPVMEAPPIRKLSKWTDVEFAKAQAEQAGFRSVKAETYEWDVPIDSAEEMVRQMTPLLPGLLAIGSDQDKLKEAQDAMLRVAVDKFGSGKPFKLKTGSACFVGHK